MNRLMHAWPLMNEAGEPGGGAQPTAEQTKESAQPAEQQKEPAAPDETGGAQPTAERPKESAQPADRPERPVNLMDDNPPDAGSEAQKAEPAPPTEEQIKSFRDGIRAIDLGEGVVFDDPALDAMQKPLMELAGNDPKKAEGIVRAYTEYRRAEIARRQERDDEFVSGLVTESRKRFGNDLGQVVSLAKSGGRRVFGDAIWNQMKSIPQFANNPDIIERLAAFGKSTQDDPGAVRKETGPRARSSDWRENMYGGQR